MQKRDVVTLLVGSVVVGLSVMVVGLVWESTSVKLEVVELESEQVLDAYCSDRGGPVEGEPGWWSGNWVEEADGRITAELEVTPLDARLEWSVRFTVLGAGLEREWVEGPFDAATTGVTFNYDTIVPADSQGLLVGAVFELTDARTGQVARHVKADEIIVRGINTASESWVRLQDEAVAIRAAGSEEVDSNGETYEMDGSYTFMEVVQ